MKHIILCCLIALMTTGCMYFEDLDYLYDYAVKDTGSDSDTETSNGTDTNSDTTYDTPTDSDTNFDTHSDTPTETVSTETGTEGDTNTNVDSDSDSDSDTGTDSLCKSDYDCDLQNYICNNKSGTCVVSSCAGMNNFTPCEIVTPFDRSYDICIDEICVSPGCGDISCNVSGPNFPNTDTNQRKCYGQEGPAACPLSGKQFFGQDAQYGWDTTHRSDQRFIENVSTTGHPVVTDIITGLVWQGCAAGATGDICNIEEAKLYSWESALAYCENLILVGYSDWRLPNEYELDSISDLDSIAPAINTASFPNTPTGKFWSSSTYADNQKNAWYVNLDYGAVSNGIKTDPQYIRCVRGDGTQPDRFERIISTPEQPIVNDDATGLIWQGCSSGFEGDACDSGNKQTFHWEDALNYCENLEWGSQTDWRLPNRKELRTLIDNRSTVPSIDTTTFMATPASWFWASTSCLNSPSCAWMVNFEYGFIGTDGKGIYSTNFARCVRGGD